MSKNFAMTGVGGYVAVRHLRAIQNTGNRLLAAVDPCDSVGILDRFSTEVSYFREFERFDRHIEKLRRGPKRERIDYVSICSPNYLHDAHIRFALRVGAHAICEKPLVLNPWNVDMLQELAQEHGARIYTVLQLRAHPSILALKRAVENSTTKRKHQVELTYITTRGKWYLISWKGNVEQSGGLATNIGIHFFDVLIWIFGEVQYQEVHYSSPYKMAGYLNLKNAEVKWYLSIDQNDLDMCPVQRKGATYRSITVDDSQLEFSNGFEELHTVVYKDILAGRGFSPCDARASIELTHNIRNSFPTGLNSISHPFLERVLDDRQISVHS
ncbi:UDP-2-acetamido-2-deoxy-D-glucuronic acid dehydrogenase (NAD+ cofactor) [Chitinispirillum alkaliphilum]|nr:UDP-2-acetamido-2-deoxy-D-glucuronic acid dehydrogenase (NAD+ cofactor) [Chitinispirillum alkaliphilum]